MAVVAVVGVKQSEEIYDSSAAASRSVPSREQKHILPQYQDELLQHVFAQGRNTLLCDDDMDSASLWVSAVSSSS